VLSSDNLQKKLKPTPPKITARDKGVFPRIGILSYKLFNHPLGWLISNLVQVLSTFRRQLIVGAETSNFVPVHHAGIQSEATMIARSVIGFNITLFKLNNAEDQLTRLISGAASQVVSVVPTSSHNRNSSFLQHRVSSQQLDALVIFDEGYDPLLYGVLHARMAPVQIVYRGATGHTQSTGLPNTVDFYVTGDTITPQKIQNLMAEQLVRIGETGDHYAWPDMPSQEEHLAVASKYRIMQKSHHYLVVSGIETFGFPMDEIVSSILLKDQLGKLLIRHETGQELWAHKLLHRLQQTLTYAGVKPGRVQLLQAGQASELAALMNAVSVVLDPCPVGMGHAAFLSLAVGTPVISCPSCQKNSRHVAAAILKLAHLSQFVAANSSHLIDIAVAAATNADFTSKQAIRAAACEHVAWRDPIHTPNCTSFNQVSGEPSPTSIKRLRGVNARKGTLVEWTQFLARSVGPWARRRSRSRRSS
jgi:predicted O-linked N-acetylglucosamine transferase (SPINDLY family)